MIDVWHGSPEDRLAEMLWGCPRLGRKARLVMKQKVQESEER